MGVDRRRLGSEHLPPEAEGTGEIAPDRRHVRRRAEPDAAAAEPPRGLELLDGAVELTAPGVDLGGVDPQVAVVGAQPQRLVQDRGRLGATPEVAECPGERQGRPGRSATQPPEPPFEEPHRLVLAVQVPRRIEVAAGQPLVLVVQAGGEPIQRKRLGQMPGVARDLGERRQSRGVERPGAKRTADQRHDEGVFARVGQQLLRVLAAEQRIGVRPAAKLAVECQTIVAPPQSLEARQLAEPEVHIVGKQPQ